MDEDIIQQISDVAHQFILDNLPYLSKHDFNQILFNNCFELFATTFQHDSMTSLDDIKDMIHFSFEHILPELIPKRELIPSLILSSPNKTFIQCILQKLKQQPQPAQRTIEWYESRHSMITASNAWKAILTDSSKLSIIKEKSTDYVIKDEETEYPSEDSATYWGILFEPLSVLLYEYLYDTKIDDYGCLTHPIYSFIGASPDGINDKEDNDRYGRMLEIKNIVNREITGIPKEEYWIQMQLQMEVCGLEECDFLETHFLSYSNFNEFDDDSHESIYFQNKEKQYKGVIVIFVNKEKKTFHYEYYPNIEYTKEQLLQWMETIQDNVILKHPELEWYRNLYWKLVQYNCSLVQRNPLWFNHFALPQLKETWNNIEMIREKKTRGVWTENDEINMFGEKKERKDKEKKESVCMIPLF